MSYKRVMQESYQATAEEFARNVADLAPMQSIEKFVRLLPPNGKMIDIGCGSGRDASIFTEKGLSVLGVDFCSNLIEIAKKNAPSAEFQVSDIETASFPPSSFDGAWAACSLSHIPKKALPAVLSNVHSFLKDKGSFYLTVKQGIGEVLEKDIRYGDFEKFWSFFEEDEIKEFIRSAKFTILECTTVQKKFAYQTHPAVRIFCQKNEI